MGLSTIQRSYTVEIIHDEVTITSTSTFYGSNKSTSTSYSEVLKILNSVSAETVLASSE